MALHLGQPSSALQLLITFLNFEVITSKSSHQAHTNKGSMQLQVHHLRSRCKGSVSC